MKNRIGVASLLVGLSIYSGLSQSAEWWNWYEPLEVKDIRVQGNRGVVSFRTEELINNPKPCISDDYYVLQPTEMNDQLMSVLLAAHASGKKVGINVDGTQCGPYGRPVVTQVRILGI